MKITKMHGLGNDFILVTQDSVTGYDLSALAQKLCTRRVNVGADGLIVVAPSKNADIQMRIFNADGSEAEMCGNGIRCFARYIYDEGILPKQDMAIQTLAGIMRPQLHLQNNTVTGISVNMGKPSFDHAQIPLISEKPALHNTISVLGKDIEVSSVLMGVPHTVVFLHASDELTPSIYGPAIEAHPAFPKKTNVNFVRVLDKNTIQITTWERGAGLTLACGTGSCAAAVIASEKGFTNKKVKVLTQTGELMIEYKETQEVIMTGPAEYVFVGEVKQPGF